MTAAGQLNRIVSLVADLSRTAGGATLAQLARRHDTTPAQIQADVRALTGLGEHADHDWRLSLAVTLQDETVTIASLGPWRRPLKLTSDEFMALQVALADDPAGAPVAARFAGLAPAAIAHDQPHAWPELDAVRTAVAGHHKLEMLYAGSGDRVGRRRVIRPHDLMVQGGRFYCVAWCEAARDWRHFRVDRMLDALVLETTFSPDDEHETPTVVFATDDPPDEVTVRFSPAIARWLKERYPAGREAADGGYDVTLDVGDPAWLLRHVLSFGAEAQVVEPPEYREMLAHGIQPA